MEEALSLAHSIDSENSRQNALYAIALALAEAGDSDAALEIFSDLPADRFAFAQRPIARVQAGAGNFSAAIATAERIEDARLRSRALAEVAVIQAEQPSTTP